MDAYSPQMEGRQTRVTLIRSRGIHRVYIKEPRRYLTGGPYRFLSRHVKARPYQALIRAFSFHNQALTQGAAGADQACAAW
jgi:hypothetical protein